MNTKRMAIKDVLEDILEMTVWPFQDDFHWLRWWFLNLKVQDPPPKSLSHSCKISIRFRYVYDEFKDFFKMISVYLRDDFAK